MSPTDRLLVLRVAVHAAVHSMFRYPGFKLSFVPPSHHVTWEIMKSCEAMGLEGVTFEEVENAFRGVKMEVF